MCSKVGTQSQIRSKVMYLNVGIILCTILSCLLNFSDANAGVGEVFISNSNSCPGRKEYNPSPEPNTFEMEFPHSLLSPQEVINEYRLYFDSKPLSHGTEINQGRVRFCGEEEREMVFKFLISQLKARAPDKRVWEVLIQHFKSATFLTLVERELKDADEADYKVNLNKLRKVITRNLNESTVPTDADLRWLKNPGTS